MSSLILKLGKFSRSSGQWQDEDYDVLADGKVVGRILESGSRFGRPELRCQKDLGRRSFAEHAFDFCRNVNFAQLRRGVGVCRVHGEDGRRGPRRHLQVGAIDVRRPPRPRGAGRAEEENIDMIEITWNPEQAGKICRSLRSGRPRRV
jgi:hypothetical protein